MNTNLFTLLIFTLSLTIHAQTRDLVNFIEIIPEEHTQIATGSPAQVLINNSQDYVLDLAGATGLQKNNSLPHISSASALIHIKNGQVQSPQINVYVPPRDYSICGSIVYRVENFKEQSFVQVRSACNEVFIDRFILKHATSSRSPSPQQKIHLSGTNILHPKVLKYGDEAYALLVRTPEVKASGEVNRGGLGNDTLILAHLDFENETYDTVAFFRLPAQPYQNFKTFFGEAKINEAFSKIYLNTSDTLFTFSINTVLPEVKALATDQYFSLDDRRFFIVNERSEDLAYYKNILRLDYRFNEGNLSFDTTILDLPTHQFSTANNLSIFGLNSTNILISETRYLENRELHLGTSLLDSLGNFLWHKQFVPDYSGLIIQHAYNVNDTLILSGFYKPGRFVINTQTLVKGYYPFGYRRTVSFRLLADGTNLDAEKLSAKEGLEVFPNPFSVDFKIAEEGATKYQLINTNGLLVKEEQLNPDIGIYRVYLPQLDFGMYILRLYKDDGEILEKKIFKTTY